MVRTKPVVRHCERSEAIQCLDTLNTSGLLHRFATLHEPLNRGVRCAEACALDRSGSFHRPAAGESLFDCTKRNQKRLAPRAPRFGVIPPPCPSLSLGSPSFRSTVCLYFYISL